MNVKDKLKTAIDNLKKKKKDKKVEAALKTLEGLNGEVASLSGQIEAKFKEAFTWANMLVKALDNINKDTKVAWGELMPNINKSAANAKTECEKLTDLIKKLEKLEEKVDEIGGKIG